MTDTTALLGVHRTLPDVIGRTESRTYQAIRNKLIDQHVSLKLTAFKNYASLPVPATTGTRLNDKYTEGTIGHRFYTSCQNVGIVESAVAECARELFGAEHVYVQPHSETGTNLIVYQTILACHIETSVLTELGSRDASELSEVDWETLRARFDNQRLPGMSLGAGRYLTHGSRPNMSGKIFHQRSRGTNPTAELPDYDVPTMQTTEFRPLVTIAGHSTHPCHIDFAKMREIIDSIGAVLVVNMAHFAGLVTNKVFTGNENPVPPAQVVTTTTHKSLCGPCGGLVLATKDYADDIDCGCPIVLGGPLSHITAVKVVALAEARTETFRDYVHRAVDNARAPAEGLLKRDDTLVTGDTDSHIVLLDVSSFDLTRRQAESAPLDSGIATSRNSVPNDPSGAWYTSGIRLGTPALMPRGFATSGMDEVVTTIINVLKKTTPTTTKDDKPSRAKYELAQEVADGLKDYAAKLLDLHPLYPGLTL